MKIKNLEDLLKRGRKGDSYVYHIGVLAVDRLRDKSLDREASAALQAFQDGKIDLFQKRLDKNRYEYRALRIFGQGKRPFSGSYAQ